MKRTVTFAAAAAVLAHSALAWTAAPDDFAYGQALALDAGAALQSLVLPDEVYRHVVHAGLTDLRVFNGEGVAVPHRLSLPPRPQAAASDAETRPVFALYSVPGEDLIGQRTRVVTGSDGDILATERVAIHGAQRHRVTAYLVDLGSAAQTPTRLALDWTEVEGAGFAAEVRVWASDDLAAWRTVIEAATLADLRSDGERLRRDTIALPARSERYLRLEWPQALEGVRLETVEVTRSADLAERPRRWMQLDPAAGEEPETIVFDTGGLYPVDRLDLALTGDNPVVHARLASRAAPVQDWIERHRGAFFRVSLGGQIVRNDPARLAPTTHRYWRLDDSDGTHEALVRQVAGLRLGWVPHTLTFLRQGPGPYTLAYGSWSTTAAGESIETLSSAIRSVSDDPQAHTGTVEAGPRVVLGGEQRLRPPAPPLPWKTWLLWAVLLLGVLALAAMTRRLLRELNRSPD